MCLRKQIGETEKNGSTDEGYATFYKGEWDNVKRSDKGKS